MRAQARMDIDDVGTCFCCAVDDADLVRVGIMFPEVPLAICVAYIQ